jgi:serine/threonine protein kinase
MSVGPGTDILVLSNIQAKALAGRLLAIGDEVYHFKDYDPAYPGQPPWRSGAEGKAFPLLGKNGSVVAYLKFFTRPTQKRLNRTAWLIGRRMHTWLPGLAAAPLLWVDTRLSFRSSTIDFDFAGYFARAVPGETWLELKNRIVEAGAPFPEAVRRRCVEDLVLATAALERAGIVHGDLSPNNVVVNPNAPPGEPALFLIDFDAFVAPTAGPDHAINVGEGGTYGTEGYCPPELGLRAADGDGSVAPYSDRFGRDMLILELLLMDSALSPDDPPVKWNLDRLRHFFTAWHESCDPAWRQLFAHLEIPGVFALPEKQRPWSVHLAAGLGLEVPEIPAISSYARIPEFPSALPGIRSVSANVQKGARRKSAPARPQKQRYPSPLARPQSLNQMLVSTAQAMSRTFRRTKKKPSSAPVQKDALAAILWTFLFMALLWMIVLIIPSCLGRNTISQPSGDSLHGMQEKRMMDKAQSAIRLAATGTCRRTSPQAERPTSTEPAATATSRTILGHRSSCLANSSSSATDSP